MSIHSHLYNGSEYVDYDNFFIGHQYFETDDWEDGTVHYDGILYRDVPLQFDIRQDELVTDNFAGPLRIRLVSQKVRQFTLLGHTFVRIVSDSLQNTGVRTGFYDQLYAGGVTLLSKRNKIIEEYIENGKLVSEFIQKDRYYILKDGRYHSVKSKKSVLSLYADRRKELQKYLRENKVRFRENPEYAMVLMTRHYDSLTRPL
jgi:hypothetical protein